MSEWVSEWVSEVAQSCPTLCDPMDCSLSGSSVHGIFQARLLEWIAISFSMGSSQLRNWTWVSRTAGRRFTVWATREAPWYHWSSIIILVIFFHSFIIFFSVRNVFKLYLCILALNNCPRIRTSKVMPFSTVHCSWIHWVLTSVPLVSTPTFWGKLSFLWEMLPKLLRRLCPHSVCHYQNVAAAILGIIFC